MAQAQSGPIRELTPNITVTVVSGGSFTSAGSLYLFGQSRNKIGYNKLGDGGSTPAEAGILVNYNAGDKIQVSYDVGSRLAGEDTWEGQIAASLTNDPTTAVILASVRFKDAATVGAVSYPGTGANLSLPLVIELSTDDDIALSQSVTDSAALPTAPIFGMIRYVQNVGEYWRYDPLAASGNFASGGGFWVSHLTGFSAYVADTAQGATATRQQGYAKPINQLALGIESNVVLQNAPYLFNGVIQPVNQAPILAVVVPSGQSSLPVNSSIAFIFRQNGADVSTALSGKVSATYLGKTDLSAGTLDTSGAGVGNPVTLGPLLDGLGGITTPEQLDSGNAFLYRVQLNVDASVLSSTFTEGSLLTYFAKAQSPLGERSPTAALSGEGVASVGEKRIVLPSVGTAKATISSGAIQSLDETTFQGHLAFSSVAQDINNISSSTDNQLVAVNTALNQVNVRTGSVESGEVQRAVIGTGLGPASGRYTASDWSNPITISGNGQQIQVTIDHPTTVRADYPDEQVRSKAAPFNAASYVVFARFGGIVYEVLTAAVGTSPQTITINSIGSTVGTLPDSSSDASFSLFDHGSFTSTAIAGSSSLVAESYEIAIAPVYDGAQITSVDHSTASGNLRVIPESAGTNIAYLNQSQIFTEGQKFEPVALTSSAGVVSIDLTESNLYTLTLTENVTAINLVGISAGLNFNLEIINPSSFTVAGWDNSIAWVGDSVPEAPSDWSVYEFRSFTSSVIRGFEWGVGSNSVPANAVTENGSVITENGDVVTDG
ncbi:MAG: hypothetical protein AAGD25_06725 [Cyanobacteria bacterium P01_F01_bin.150]